MPKGLNAPLMLLDVLQLWHFAVYKTSHFGWVWMILIRGYGARNSASWSLPSWYFILCVIKSPPGMPRTVHCDCEILQRKWKLGTALAPVLTQNAATDGHQHSPWQMLHGAGPPRKRGRDTIGMGGRPPDLVMVTVRQGGRWHRSRARVVST